MDADDELELHETDLIEFILFIELLLLQISICP